LLSHLVGVLMRFLTLAECYANKGFAEGLADCLRNISGSGFGIRVIHKPNMGCDEILSRVRSDYLSRFCRNYRDECHNVVIVVIDREEGVSSLYIDKWLCAEHSASVGAPDFNIDLCVKEVGNWVVVGVVFNPRIEEAFICKLKPSICRNPVLLNQVKSSEGTDKVKDMIRRYNKVSALIKDLANNVISFSKYIIK